MLEQPSADLHQIYRALNVIEADSDYIQSELYKKSERIIDRKKGILYYDCTNYYFEIEQDDEFRKYGLSKEHRPNPIVQILESLELFYRVVFRGDKLEDELGKEGE